MRRLFDWIFYGHVWIAAAATALSWLSVRLVFGSETYTAELPLYAMIFAATLSVYTLHRLLSFRRAKGVPTAVRYRLVRRQPRISLFVGLAAGLAAAFIGFRWLPLMLTSLLWAVPITVFYLTPPLPGWRRLRDLPYLKVVWVGLAWSIITVEVPLGIVGTLPEVEYPDLGVFHCFGPPWNYSSISTTIWLTRFLFTTTVALLFDLRDVDLDERQGVRTLANDRPRLHRCLVAICLLGCALLSGNFIAYALMVPVAYLSYRRTDEDWYAVAVNGLLFVPPFVYWAGAQV